MDGRVRRILSTMERAVRPRAVAAIRQAGEAARTAAAAERTSDALATVLAELQAVGHRLDQVEEAVRLLGEPAGPSNSKYDRQTDQVFGRVLRPNDVCLDVGAHEGLLLQRMLHHAPAGHHHAFEPLPAMAAVLRERFPGVEVHEVALAAERGESSFHHVVSNTSYSGLRERRYDRPEEQVEIITVRTARLDDEVPAAAPVRLVKIDVEGGEEGVLRGGIRTLERCRPYVVFEHGLGAADRYGTTPETVHELLTACGLEVGLMERWLAGGPPLSSVEFADEFSSGRNYYFMAYPAT